MLLLFFIKHFLLNLKANMLLSNSMFAISSSTIIFAIEYQNKVNMLLSNTMVAISSSTIIFAIEYQNNLRGGF